MTITVSSGSFSADGFSAAISVPHRARLILKGPTFGGGTVHLCVADAAGTYYRTGRSWSSVGVETIDTQGVEGMVKLELAGSTSPTVGWEIAVKR